MKKSLLAIWATLTIPISRTALLGAPTVTEKWRSPVSTERPYTSTLEVTFDHNGIAELTREAMTAMLGDAGWKRLA